jgi:TRAP-type mannitol/chloroaromatic compound transport system substrate-binding protein
MRQLPDEVTNAIGQRAGEVCAAVAAKDAVSQELFSHIVKFRSSVIRWTGVSEKEYLRIRNLPFSFPRINFFVVPSAHLVSCVTHR